MNLEESTIEGESPVKGKRISYKKVKREELV